jgi:hypothetical protein
LNEHSLEDCLGRQRATAIYIVGGWVCHGFNRMVFGSTLDGLATRNTAGSKRGAWETRHYEPLGPLS